MPTLPTKSFNQIVSDTIAGIQGRSTKLTNFGIGSTLRAIVEGFGGLFLWFQALVLQLLTAIRLSTSSGIDVDTFTADFMPIIPGSQTAALPGGSPRLGSQASSGQVTYGRLTAGPSSCFIAVGSTVRTGDGTQSFTVTADPTFGSFSQSLNGYTLPASVANVNVPVLNNVPGAAGNVVIGAINVMTSNVTGIDSVINNADFTNGADFEKDAALKLRFVAYILGLARGDIYGLTSAILGTNVTIQWNLTEYYNYDGSVRYGYFFVIADDGSGSPSPGFLSGILNTVNSVRPLGTQCQVFPPTIVSANVSMQVATAAGFVHSAVVAAVIAAVTLNINSLGLGNSLPFSVLSSWAYQIPGVTAVTAVLLNGLTGDIATLNATRATLDGLSTIADRTIKAGTVIIS
jgi:uncharacterized phage protein gp47/JayE